MCEKKGQFISTHAYLDMPRKFLEGHLRNECQRLPLRREVAGVAREHMLCCSVSGCLNFLKNSVICLKLKKIILYKKTQSLGNDIER